MENRRKRKALAAALERIMGIEPTYPAWEAGVLPMNYIRVQEYYSTSRKEMQEDFSLFCDPAPLLKRAAEGLK